MKALVPTCTAILMVSFFFVFSGCSNEVDVLKNPPQPKTPDALAVEYVRALKSQDREKVLSLCSPELRELLHMAEKAFSQQLAHAKFYDLEKSFSYSLKSHESNEWVFVFRVYHTKEQKRTKVEVVVEERVPGGYCIGVSMPTSYKRTDPNSF